MIQEQWFVDAIQDRPDFFLFGKLSLLDSPGGSRIDIDIFLLDSWSYVGTNRARLGMEEYHRCDSSCSSNNPGSHLWRSSSREYYSPLLSLQRIKLRRSRLELDPRLRSRGQVQYESRCRTLHGNDRFRKSVLRLSSLPSTSPQTNWSRAGLSGLNSSRPRFARRYMDQNRNSVSRLHFLERDRSADFSL